MLYFSFYKAKYKGVHELLLEHKEKPEDPEIQYIYPFFFPRSILQVDAVRNFSEWDLTIRSAKQETCCNAFKIFKECENFAID